MASNVILATSPAFVPAVFKASNLSGKSAQAVVTLLMSGQIDWSNETQVAAIASAYRLGRMAGTLGLPQDKAQIIADKSKHNPDKHSDDRRTFAEERAYNAAKAMWAHTATLAGMPKRNGEARTNQRSEAGKAAITEAAAKVATVEAKKAAKLSQAQALVAKLEAPAEGERDYASFAAELAAMAEAFDRKATLRKAKAGPWRAILADFAKAVRDASKKVSQDVEALPEIEAA